MYYVARDVGEREGSCVGAIYQLSTPSKNSVSRRIGFVRCIYNALLNNNYCYNLDNITLDTCNVRVEGPKYEFNYKIN